MSSRPLHALILGVFVIVFYFGQWNAFFYSHDDYLWTGIMRNRDTFWDAVSGVENGVRFLNFGMVWVKTQLFDINAVPYLFSSLLQHIVVSYLVYRLIEIWTDRRFFAFVAAILFATKFSYWEIVTSVSASDYSFWAMFYLLTFALFCAYLKWRKRSLYIASIIVYAILAFGHDFTLNLPLVLAAYHLTLGRGSQPLRSLGWADLKLHLPFWVLWAIHVVIQFSYIFSGTSEAVYSSAGYGPGLHIIANFRFLGSHIIPNIPIYDRLAQINPAFMPILEIVFLSTAIVLNVLLVYLLWKGSSLVRFAVALVYLPFLQYTPWYGDFAGAPRYLYFSSIGISVLLALLLFQLYEYLQQRQIKSSRYITVGLFAAVLAFNLVVVQLWVQRNIQNSVVRREFVTQFANEFQSLEPETDVYIEVPETKFIDLAYTCNLLFEQPPDCLAFSQGEFTLQKVLELEQDAPVYWLTVHGDGSIEQVYPPLVVAD